MATGTLSESAGLSDSLDDSDPLKEDIDDFISHFEEWRTYSRRQGVAELIQRLYADTAYVTSSRPCPAVTFVRLT